MVPKLSFKNLNKTGIIYTQYDYMNNELDKLLFRIHRYMKSENSQNLNFKCLCILIIFKFQNLKLFLSI